MGSFGHAVLVTEDKTFWQLKNCGRHAAAVHTVFGIISSCNRTCVSEVLVSLGHTACQWNAVLVSLVPVHRTWLWRDVHYPLCTLRHSRTSHIGVSTLTFASFSVTDALTRVVLIVREDDANLSVEICKTVIG